jgi:hypothetical protein
MVYRKGSYREADVSFGLFEVLCDIRRIDEGDGIEAAFIKNEAKYHESCRLMFNNTTLQRVQKRHQPIKHFDQSVLCFS